MTKKLITSNIKTVKFIRSNKYIDINDSYIVTSNEKMIEGIKLTTGAIINVGPYRYNNSLSKNNFSNRENL